MRLIFNKKYNDPKLFNWYRVFDSIIVAQNCSTDAVKSIMIRERTKSTVAQNCSTDAVKSIMIIVGHIFCSQSFKNMTCRVQCFFFFFNFSMIFWFQSIETKTVTFCLQFGIAQWMQVILILFQMIVASTSLLSHDVANSA